MKLTVLFVAALLSGLELRAETGLFEAVRNGDLATVQTLIRSGAGPNSRNYIGVTPLMYAAAFASQELVHLLLDSGADVNATSNAGATALMWATGNTSNVRLLLERGAAVDAKAKDGTTVLQTAALRGNVDTMKLLIARGADAKASAEELLRLAYRRADPEMRQFLEGAGFEFKNMKQPGAPFFGPICKSRRGAQAPGCRSRSERGCAPGDRQVSGSWHCFLPRFRGDCARIHRTRRRSQHVLTPESEPLLMMAAVQSRTRCGACAVFDREDQRT